MAIYAALEGVRNQGKMQLEHVRKQLRHLNADMPEFTIIHEKLATRAFEVWMCTIGASICPERRDDVQKIWQMLKESIPYINEGVALIKNEEQTIAKITGEITPRFDFLERKDLHLMCNDIPSAFQ